MNILSNTRNKSGRFNISKNPTKYILRKLSKIIEDIVFENIFETVLEKYFFIIFLNFFLETVYVLWCLMCEM